MKTKKIEVVNAIKIEVNCKENDWGDIEIGGPAFIGYIFYINPDNENNIDNVIKRYLKKYDRPLIEIIHSVSKDFNVKNLWTDDMVDKCIKENDVW